MKLVSTDSAPRPAGHYAQAVVHAGWVFVSGQLPLDPTTGAPDLGDARQQTARVLQNVAAILLAAGSSLQDIVQMRVYITDVVHWPAVNAACAEALGPHTPARTVIPCGPLRHGALVEMEVVAIARSV